MHIASLPWYDLPEIRVATNLFWARLAESLRSRGFRGVPSTLDRGRPFPEQWTSGHLLFSQACGYDCLLPYSEHLQVAATPAYTAPGCRGPYYNSFVVVHKDSPADRFEDLRGARCVVNEMTSHSGMNALRALVAPLHRQGQFFANVQISGSHVYSLQAVGAREADVAAIDCVTYELLRRYRPESLRQVRVLCECTPMPAPPYVVGSQWAAGELLQVGAALSEALQDPALQAVKDTLLLDRVESLPLSAYQPIAALEQAALQRGYEELGACGLPRALAAEGPMRVF
jgi:ABC-type phosphate/phosphonate transport system substrate-binding protein